MSRRSFLKSATFAAAAAGAFVGARKGFAQDGALRAGLIGCGGRGTGAAHQFLEGNENAQVVALADLFQDRLDGARTSLVNDRGQTINDDMCFIGFDAYEKLIATDVDVVLCASPPHFRQREFPAAIAAGKHVFMEKPIAVDPVSARAIAEAADLADQKKLSVVVGAQRRHQASYIECRQRVLDGAIGDIIGARAYWIGGPLGGWDRTDAPTKLGDQIRSWFHFCWLSGDHIVEQHIHNIDMCLWFMDKNPVDAVGMGYRARKTFGDSYDFFSVEFGFDNGVKMESKCRQVVNCHNDVSEYVVGTKGIANCGGDIWDYSGNRIWNWQGDAPSPYVQEHTDLGNAIRSEQPINDAHDVVRACFAAIMGRTSAYTGKKVTWDEIMQAEWKLGPTEYDVDAEFPIAPVPQPGL